jgi:hypothetical protein
MHCKCYNVRREDAKLIYSILISCYNLYVAARCTTVRSINVTLTLTSFGHSKVFLKEVLGLAVITSNSPALIKL